MATIFTPVSIDVHHERGERGKEEIFFGDNACKFWSENHFCCFGVSNTLSSFHPLFFLRFGAALQLNVFENIMNSSIWSYVPSQPKILRVPSA